MKILINIGHPAHVHLFKNMIKKLEKGHIIKIVTRDKDVTLKLLDAYGFEYEVMSGYYTTTLGKMYDFIKTDLKLLKIAIKTKPDMLIAVGDPYVAQVGKLIRKPSIVFTDTEHAKLANKLTFPFTTVICTPSCYKEYLGKKQVRYNGYKELAYLHPNYFKPDSSVLDDLRLSKDDKFIIMRLIAWEATHDIHSRGFSKDFIEKAIKSLEEYGHVYITSERKLNRNLEKYKMQIPPEKIHSALYYANLYFGEGGTTAVEAALLGTPSVHVEAFKTKSGEVKDATQIHGNFDELVNKYRMLSTFADTNQAFNTALQILQDKNAKKDMERKRERLLKEKIDVTAFMTSFIENYPESFYECINSKEK